MLSRRGTGALTGMLLAVAVAEIGHAVTPDGFPNSLAMDHPPRGWRSWSAYAGDVNQQLIEQVMNAMVKKRAGGRSLADLGYTGANTPPLAQPARTQTPRIASFARTGVLKKLTYQCPNGLPA